MHALEINSNTDVSGCLDKRDGKQCPSVQTPHANRRFSRLLRHETLPREKGGLNQLALPQVIVLGHAEQKSCWQI